MLCQKCKKNTATTHIKRSINGNTMEMHLCSSCAKEQGVSHMFSGFPGFMDMHSSFDNLMGGLFTENKLRLGEEIKCPGCGDTFSEIVDKGKVGCPQCYITFYDDLLPSIERIHGKTKHVGKKPHVRTKSLPMEANKNEKIDTLQQLKDELQECVNKQEYERCAELRDQIAQLEKEEKGEE